MLDLTKFKDKSKKNRKKKYVYELNGFISHEPTLSKEESMYTAVVKKRMEGKGHKQWLKFNKKKMREISELAALNNYSAQVLFYSLVDHKE